jgi:hypothetical protein
MSDEFASAMAEVHRLTCEGGYGPTGGAMSVQIIPRASSAHELPAFAAVAHKARLARRPAAVPGLRA